MYNRILCHSCLVSGKRAGIAPFIAAQYCAVECKTFTILHKLDSKLILLNSCFKKGHSKLSAARNWRNSRTLVIYGKLRKSLFEKTEMSPHQNQF